MDLTGILCVRVSLGPCIVFHVHVADRYNQPSKENKGGRRLNRGLQKGKWKSILMLLIAMTQFKTFFLFLFFFVVKMGGSQPFVVEAFHVEMEGFQKRLPGIWEIICIPLTNYFTFFTFTATFPCWGIYFPRRRLTSVGPFTRNKRGPSQERRDKKIPINK